MTTPSGRLDLRGRPWGIYVQAEILRRPFTTAAEEYELCGLSKSEWYDGKRRKDAEDFPNAEELRMAAQNTGASLVDMLVDFGMVEPSVANPGYLGATPLAMPTIARGVVTKAKERKRTEQREVRKARAEKAPPL